MENEKKLSAVEKLRILEEFFQLNAAQFAKKIGVSPTKIYDIKRGQIKNISSDLLEKILQNCPEINPSWLITGQGDVAAGKYIINTERQNGNNYQGGTVSPTSPELMTIISSQQETISKQTDQIDRLISIIEQKM